MPYQHRELASGRWYALTLAEQLGNVGSEVSRAMKARGNEERYWNALTRAYELLDLTILDSRLTRMRRKEILRVRELLGDAALGGMEYGTRLEDLDRYFFLFALEARRGK